MRHCRIGSSEMSNAEAEALNERHCRIGSSEKHIKQRIKLRRRHCRIGSSEMQVRRGSAPGASSLPDRQLRKCSFA